MIYNKELQKTDIAIDEKLDVIEVPIGEHVGNYDGAKPLFYDSMVMHSVRMYAEANRIFKTKAHMIAYIEDRINADGTISDEVTDDTIKSALPGIILTVINDDNPDNNGMYYIENADPNVTPGLSANKINITGPILHGQIDELFT
jgi:hypothetical protein